jgi:hypothetical protein
VIAQHRAYTRKTSPGETSDARSTRGSCERLFLLIIHSTDRCELFLLSVLLNNELIVLDKFVLVLSEPSKRQHQQTASELRLEECRNHVRKWEKVIARGRGEEERSTG